MILGMDLEMEPGVRCSMALQSCLVGMEGYDFNENI